MKISSIILCLSILSSCAVGSGILSGAGAVRSYKVEQSVDARLDDLERSLEYILELMEKRNDLR
tara:strand:- start:2663 stop:2854 length:192 start_codon:yes stop_codon:yes gene_type:complete